MAEAAHGKPRARLITLAWGAKYVHKLLNLTLPALLAPGNYPHLAATFDCEFVLLTERRFFDEVSAHPTFKRLAALGLTRLRGIDDLLIGPGSYGLTLSLAFYRAIEDLGPSMRETNLLFLNADFVLADDSYRTLTAKLLAGERLVLSPSYCANEEDVLSRLLSHKQGEVLACPKRTMAGYLLGDLHDTVRGQIVDNPFHYEQVYVYQHYVRVDYDTLIGRQMPISIVAMRPTRHVEEMRTFWDFGAASEFCPDTPPCVLGNSDEYLMLELRPRGEGRDLLRLGTPDAERVAAMIGSVLTRDQREFSRYELILHAGDLPPLGNARLKLKDFSDRFHAALPRDPAAHVDHPMWEYHARLYRRSERAQVAVHADKSGSMQPPPLSNEEFRDEIIRRLNAIEAQLEMLLNEAQLPANRLHDLQAQMRQIWGVVLPERDSIDLKRFVARPESCRQPHGPIRAFARNLRGKLLGSSPNFSILNPVGKVYEDGHRLLASTRPEAQNILAVSDFDSGARTLAAQAGKNWIRVPWKVAVTNHLYLAEDKFDVAYIETPLECALELPQVLIGIQPVLKDGASVIAVLVNFNSTSIPLDSPKFVDAMCPRDCDVRIAYRGGIVPSAALRAYVWAAENLRRKAPHRFIAALVMSGVSLSLSAIASRGFIRRTTQPRDIQTACVSATIELTPVRSPPSQHESVVSLTAASALVEPPCPNGSLLSAQAEG